MYHKTMEERTAMKLCENHLTLLFEAIKSNDVENVEKIEHTLTPQEECVACAYLLKAGEPVASALSRFLKQEGFHVVVPSKQTRLEHLLLWLLRISLFASSILIALGIESIAKQILFQQYSFGPPSVSSFGIIEMIGIGILSLLIFLTIDDRFID